MNINETSEFMAAIACLIEEFAEKQSVSSVYLAKSLFEIIRQRHSDKYN